MHRPPRNLWVATLASLLTDISSEMLAYLTPLFLANVLRAAPPLIGLIDGLADLVTSWAKLGAGVWSDRWRNRKTPVVLGYSLSTLSKGALALAGAWPVVLAARLADRLGKGIRTAPRDALIAESVPADQRGAAFGFHRAGDTLGAFVGVGVAWLVISWGSAAQLTAEAYALVAALSVIPAGAAVAVLMWGVREAAPPAPTSTDSPRTWWQSRHALPRRFWLVLAVMAVFALGNSADSFIVLRAQERGAGVDTMLLMVLTFNLVYTVLAQPLGRLSDKVGQKRLLALGWLVYAGVYTGLALAQDSTHVWLLWALYGVYYALTEGIGKALVAGLVPAAVRGTAYGWLNGLLGLVALPASVMMGALWQAFGPAAGFGVGAALAGVAALALAALPLPADGKIG